MSYATQLELVPDLRGKAAKAIKMARRSICGTMMDAGLTRQDFLDQCSFATMPETVTVYTTGTNPHLQVVAVRFSDMHGALGNDVMVANIIWMDNEYKLVYTPDDHDDLANELAVRWPNRAYITYKYGPLVDDYIAVSHYDPRTNRLFAVPVDPNKVGAL